MNQSIIPCWWFEGNANEAFEFYTQIFPNSEITYSDNILVEANLMGVKFSGINGGEMNRPNDAISYMITLESKSEIKTIGNHLLENGEVLMPLDSYPWSSYYGWIRDKYGISWQLYLGKLSDVNHQKIAPTLMFGGSQQGNCQSAIDLYYSIFKDYKSQGIL